MNLVPALCFALGFLRSFAGATIPELNKRPDGSGGHGTVLLDFAPGVASVAPVVSILLAPTPVPGRNKCPLLATTISLLAPQDAV